MRLRQSVDDVVLGCWCVSLLANEEARNLRVDDIVLQCWSLDVFASRLCLLTAEK